MLERQLTVSVMAKCTVIDDCYENIKLYPDPFSANHVRMVHGIEANSLILDKEDVVVTRKEAMGVVWFDFSLPGYCLRWLEDIHKSEGWHEDIVEGRA